MFVVGLPRSGTTLVERILSSHSQMASAGELNDFANVLKAATGVRSKRQASAELIDAATGIDLRRSRPRLSGSRHGAPWALRGDSSTSCRTMCCSRR